MSFSTPPPADDETRRPAEDAAIVAQRRKHDEWMAVVVALVGIGSIFWWAVTQKYPGFDLASWSLSPSPTPTAPPPSLPPVSSGASTSPTLSLNVKPAPLPAAKLSAPLAPEALPPNAIGPVWPSTSPTAVPLTSGNATVGTTTPTVPAPAMSPSGSAAPAPAASMPPASAPTPKATISFADVPADYWALPYIQALGKRGILEGAGGQFQPDKLVTRAEFAAMLQKAFFDKAPLKATTDFKDILPSYWGLPAIREAVKLGFMSGYTDGNFRATKPIPKLEGIVAIAAGLQLADTAAVDVTKLYKDGTQVPKWAIAKIASATESGLVVNYPESTVLNSAQPLTRADAAALIYQALVKTGKVPAIASNYIAKP
jgi:S-layer homology domain